MSGSNTLKSGTSRVDAHILLRMLLYISQHGGVAGPELCDEMELSRATVMRIISNAKSQYGILIAWRRDNTMPSNGEYTVEDWGVFNPLKVKKFLQASKKSV